MNYSQLELTLKKYRPDVVHVHSSDLERSAYIDFLLSRTDVPFLLTIHGLYSLDQNLQTKYDADSLERRLLEQLSEKGVLITFVSSGLKNAAIQHFAIAGGRLIVVPNGVDIDRFRPVPPPRKDEIRMKYGIPLQRKVLIQVGELYRLKNHMFVLRCLALLDSRLRQKLYYVIVGDGAEKPSLIRFCRENQLLECCTFVGRRYASELAELYEAADLLVVPSTTEAFPLVMLEAMATGLPVLTFGDLWPIQDIANLENTLLVQQRTVESFNDALDRAIQRSWSQPEIRKFAEQFTWPIVAKRYHALYSQIVSQSRTQVSANESVVDSMREAAGIVER
jgi:glycosyltransferase involved in cell wall biosynthesis